MAVECAYKCSRYACYFSVVTIVRNHYRAEDDAGELEARKTLTMALKELEMKS